MKKNSTPVLLFALFVFFPLLSYGQIFQREVLYPGATQTTRVHKTMDVDLDGDVDYLAAYSGKYALYESADSLILRWLPNDGSGNFGTPVPISVPAGKRLSRFECADINNDGKTDLIMALANSGQTSISIYVCYHTAGAGFDAPVLLFPGTLTENFDHFQDINGDGYPDYLTSNIYSLNLTNGTFGPSMQFGQGYGSSDADLYDMDEDGMKDLVYGWSTSAFDPDHDEFISWKKQVSPGVFGPSQLINDTIKGVQYLKVFKDSATNTIQIAVNCYGPTLRGYVLKKSTSGFTVFAGIPAFPSARFFRLKSVSGNDVLLDFMGDELRLCNCSSSAYPGLEFYDSGIYKDHIHGSLPPAFGDLDGNGKPDMIIDGRAWYSFDGYHKFSPGKSIDTQTRLTTRLLEADVNGDGRTDLVNLGKQHITWFPRLAGNTWGASQHIGFHPFIEDNKLEIIDFDTDGKLDLLIYSSFANSLLVYKGLGVGQFEDQPRILPISNSPGGTYFTNQFQAKDINADGKPDAVVRYLSKLWYAKGNGSTLTNFQVLINDSISQVPVLFCDVDQDGKEDVVAYYRNRLSWYKRLTNTTFSTRKVLFTGINPSANFQRNCLLLSDDSDNDGDKDIVFYDHAGQKIFFLKNDGAGNFTLSESQAVPIPNPPNIYLKDMAGDHYPDPVIVFNSSTVSVSMMNGTPSGIKPLTSIIDGDHGNTAAFFKNSDSQKYDVALDSNGKILIYRNHLDLARTISGRLYLDLNDNCTDDSEPGLVNIIVRCKPGSYLSATNENGQFEFLVPFGNYLVEPVVRQGSGFFLDSICPAFNQAVQVDSSGAGATSFGALLKTCPFLQVTVHTPRRRRCARNNAFVTITNSGMATAYQTLVKIRLPRHISMIEPGIWAWNASDSTYQILVDSIPALASKKFNWIDSVHCKNGLIGQWQCTQAWISPGNTTCLPTIQGWDQSIIRLKATCEPAAGMKLIIKNTGPGNMISARSFRLYAGDTILQTSSYQLNSGDSLVLTNIQPGTRVEADQGDANPFGKWVSSTFMGCGNPHSGPSLMFSHNFAAFGDEAEECRQIRDSYDPNEKTAVPAVIGPDNFVRSGTSIAYTLHFQNLGNDTAFKVLVADTLSADLDPKSLQVTGSSHPFTLRISGNEQRASLHFTFDPIALTDTLTSKEQSTGFVSFLLKLKPGLPQGRIITNTASIYFDQNDAVVTNTTTHTVRDTYPVFTSVAGTFHPKQILVTPNPTNGSFQVQSADVPGGTLRMSDLQGKTVYEWKIPAGQLQKNIDVRNRLAPGLYLLKLEPKNGTSWVGKVVIQ